MSAVHALVRGVNDDELKDVARRFILAHDAYERSELAFMRATRENCKMQDRKAKVADELQQQVAPGGELFILVDARLVYVRDSSVLVKDVIQ